MDTSPEYIRQCEKAKEIQQAYNGEGGFFCVVTDGKYGRCEFIYGAIAPLGIGIDGKGESYYFIWLPLTDQLQEMIDLPGRQFVFSNEMTTNEKYSDKYTNKCLVWRGEEGYWTVYAKSMAQLWLAFVMFELYKKKWSGTEWVASC